MPGNNDTIFEGGVKEKSIEKLDEPKMYKVMIHNDHYSTMEFVIEVLVKIFHMPAAKATQIMLDVHKKGMGICGVYIKDIAITKVDQIHQMAKERQYPLKASYEEE